MPVEKKQRIIGFVGKYIWKIEIPTGLVKAMCFIGKKCV